VRAKGPACRKRDRKSYVLTRRAGITAKLIREPAIPMRVPDTILRALVYPYSSKNGTLHMATYIYLKVEDGRWILGEYLERTGSADRVIKPLSKTVKEKK